LKNIGLKGRKIISLPGAPLCLVGPDLFVVGLQSGVLDPGLLCACLSLTNDGLLLIVNRERVSDKGIYRNHYRRRRRHHD
jgi:hypothetical protein